MTETIAGEPPGEIEEPEEPATAPEPTEPEPEEPEPEPEPTPEPSTPTQLSHGDRVVVSVPSMRGADDVVFIVESFIETLKPYLSDEERLRAVDMTRAAGLPMHFAVRERERLGELAEAAGITATRVTVGEEVVLGGERLRTELVGGTLKLRALPVRPSKPGQLVRSPHPEEVGLTVGEVRDYWEGVSATIAVQLFGGERTREFALTDLEVITPAHLVAQL